jgi:hypothetical protein
MATDNRPPATHLTPPGLHLRLATHLHFSMHIQQHYWVITGMGGRDGVTGVLTSVPRAGHGSSSLSDTTITSLC